MPDEPEAVAKLWGSIWASPDSEPVANSRLGQTLDGKFEVQELLGEGGMGTVYRARNTWTNRVGALKLLKPLYAAEGEIVARFRREAMTFNAVQSPLIVETLDAGRLPSGEFYLFMELLEGTSLASRLARLKREGLSLTVAEATGIVIQACRGLAVAHASGVIHRDIKPDNLFITSSGSLKLLDFGIAKFRSAPDDGALETRAIMGTPGYMAPEQFVSTRDVDERADLFSLGLVLKECLAECRSAVPPALELVIARATALDPSSRFPSADAFAEALEPYAQMDALGRDATVPSLLPSAPASAEPAAEPARRFSPWLLAGIALAATGAFAGLRAEQEAAPSPSVTARTAPQTDRRFRLGIRPADVLVEVDGTPVPVLDGTVLVSGQPGETRLVRLWAGERSVLRNVSVTHEGLMPPAVELPDAAPDPSSSASRVVERRTGRAVTSAQPLADPATPAPSAPPTTLDKLKKTFE